MRKERPVVAFASKKGLDRFLRSLPEKLQFFSSRPAVLPINSAATPESLRDRYWPVHEPPADDKTDGK
jgi:hypothetical protein